MAGAMVNDVVNRTAKAASSLVFIGYSPYLVYGYYLPGMTGSVIHQKKCLAQQNKTRTGV
jgi:hypothetical protein